jgi:hypothetical protein
MGLHLIAGTFNQAALARHQDRISSAAWLGCAALFMIWTFLPVVGDPLTRVEVGYMGSTVILAALLWLIYRAGRGVRATLPGLD